MREDCSSKRLGLGRTDLGFIGSECILCCKILNENEFASIWLLDRMDNLFRVHMENKKLRKLQ